MSFNIFLNHSSDNLIPIPRTTLFLIILIPHIFAGLTCVVTGIVAMFSRKMRGRHSLFGTIYYFALAALFVSSATLSILRFTEDGYLLALGTLSFFSASLGRRAMRQGWPGRVRIHIAGMGLSYVFLLIAFYMDNGKNLPLWKDLPSTTYWLLPTVLGVFFIGRALISHPLARNNNLAEKKIL